MQQRPDPLPNYAWAGVSPEAAGVPHDVTEMELPPLLAYQPTVELPPAPAEQLGDLVVVEHPAIRTLAAYWHEGWPYAVSGTWLRPEAATRLYRAAESLPAGFGMAIWDGWRDIRLQQELYDAYYANAELPPGFVSAPDSDPTKAPPHATGGTVDLTLTWQQQPLNLGTPFDAFVPRAAATSLEPAGEQPARNLRRLLAAVMQEAGFIVLATEWWHWEFGTRLWAAATDESPRYGRTSLPS